MPSVTDHLEKLRQQPTNRVKKTVKATAPTNVTTAKERMAAARSRATNVAKSYSTKTPKTFGELDSSSLLKSMFSLANTYTKTPSVLQPIVANAFSSAYTTYQTGIADPNSDLFNPYSKPTNYKAIDGLAQYGYDVTQMTDDDLRDLLKHKRTTATGYNAAAPTNSSTPEQNAAYWAQEYLEASERTSAAESELADMQRTVDYYANTLGLSDDEIVQRVNSSDAYPTLRKMQEARASGSATLLNRAIDYNGDETVMGMIFAARNGGTTLGSYALNAGAYSAGLGNVYKADEEAVARRDASNVKTYNPYAGGTTLEDLGLRYGVSKFDAKWLEQNKSLLNTEDADDYRKIKTAVENSEQAEKEYAELQAWVQERKEKGKTAEDVREAIADEDFWDKYKTLRKMEEARANGTSIPMGSGVDFTAQGFDAYIDSVFPETVTPETFTLASFKEEGGDENILHNEVSRWLNGRGTTSPEGEAFVQKYGWLFSGGEEKAAWGDTYIVDERKRDPRLGKTAYSMLVQAQDAAAEGVLSNDDYVAFTMTVAEQMENAEAAGKSLEDYLADNMGELPDIGTIIEENRAAKKVRDAEREKAAALALRTSIEDADAAVASGTATAEQQALVDELKSMDVSEAVAENPEIAADRQKLTSDLSRYAQTNLVGKLAAVYGDYTTGYVADVREAEAMDHATAVATEAALNISDIAAGYYDDDYKRAAVMGLDMQTYYEMYPDRVLSVEDAYNRAFAEYTNTWSSVWTAIDKQAKQVAAGQMVIPQQSMLDLTTRAEEGGAAYEASKPKDEIEYGEGVGAMQVIRSSAAAGSYAAAEGTLSAIQYFVTSSTDAATEAANRAMYGNDPAAYREALIQGAAEINDPEEREAWEYLINNYEGDIYNVTMNFADERVKNAMRSIQRKTVEIGEFMQENGTEAENDAFRFGTSAVTNAIYLAETGVMTAVGVPATVSASLVYGAPAGADMGRRLEASGLGEDAARGAALGYAALTGWLESSMLGEFIPNLASKGTTSLVSRGLSWVTKKSSAATSKLLNWAVAMPLAEGVQEAEEYLVGTAYEGFFQSIAKGDISAAGQEIAKLFDKDELVDNFVMGGLMAPLLGTVGAGVNTAINITTAGSQKLFKSVEKARSILENGEATVADVQEFTEALAADVQDPDFVAQANAVATETQRAESVVSALLRNDTETASAIAQKSQEAAKLRKGVRDAEAALTAAQKQKASYQELLDENMLQFLEDPSDQAKGDYVREMTALVAETQQEIDRAQTALATAQENARGAELELGQYQQQQLAEARQEARVTVAQNAAAEAARQQRAAERQENRDAFIVERRQAPAEQTAPVAEQAVPAMEQASMEDIVIEQPAAEAPVQEEPAPAQVEEEMENIFAPDQLVGTLMQDRDLDVIKDRKLKPLVVENAENGEAFSTLSGFFEIAANILMDDLLQSQPGMRFVLGDTSVGGSNYTYGNGPVFTGQKRITTHEIAQLLDGGMSRERLEAILLAYTNKDMEYIAKHRADAKKVELAFDELLKRGYTTLGGVRVEPMPEYREFMGYPELPKPDPNASDEDVYFYGGSSAASAQAVQATAGGDSRIDSPVKVAETLLKELKIGSYSGPRGSSPQYHWFSNYVQRSTLEHADYLKSMHEIGHGLSKLLGMTATDAMVANGMFGADKAEAFAEFVSAYMANRDVAITLAGDAFVQDFEARLREKGAYKAVNKAATQVRNYFAASAEAQVDAQIVNRSDASKGDKEFLRNLMTRQVDHAFAGRKVDAVAGDPEYGLEDAMHYRAYHKRMFDVIWGSRMVDSNNEPIGCSFKSMLANGGINAKNIDDLLRYKLVLHAKDRAVQNKPVFGEHMTEAKMNDIIARTPDNIKQASEAWDAWWDQFSHAWFVETGIVTEDQYSRWREMYPHYVPTMRDMGKGVTKDVSSAIGGKGGWKFHEAKGSDLDIINPLDSISDLIASIINRVADNTVGQKFDQMYQANENMGIFAKQIPASDIDATVESTGDTFADFARLQNRPNTIMVKRADGTSVLYEFSDKLLLEAMSSSGPKAVDGLLRAAQSLNRGVAALTTSLNIAFGGRNALRDFPKATTYGSFATTELDALPKWLANLANVAVRKDQNYEEYENLGGGGWSVTDAATSKGRVELRSAILKGYRGETLGEKAGWLSRKMFRTITMSQMNEILEQTTRQAEFNSAKNKGLRASSVEGKRKAFLAAQDVTVDFARYGTSRNFSTMKALVHFYGPSVQGLAQQANIIADAFGNDTPAADRALAWERIGKTALTYGMRAALQVALVAMCFDDDDREGYSMLADDMKGQNLILPAKWFAGNTDRERRFVRIPMAQGILDNTLYAGFLNSMSNIADMDEASINFLDVASRIIGDALPVDVTSLSGAFNSTVFAVPYSVASNTNWYGSPIVSASMEQLHATHQYNETTPTLFVDLSKAIYDASAGRVEISPLVMQYVAEQYTGFFGQVIIPFISRDQATQKWSASAGAQNVLRKIRNGYTIEPLYSNDISGEYYDYADSVSQILNTPDGRDLPGIRASADRDDALRDAEALQAEFSRVNKEVKALSKEIDEINSDATLDAGERVMQTKAPTEARLELMEGFNDMYSEYMQTYGTQTIWERLFDLVAQ